MRRQDELVFGLPLPQRHKILVHESSHLASFRLIIAVRTRKDERHMQNAIIDDPKTVIALLLVSDLQVASSDANWISS
jgi:hypothetical protein